MVHNATPHSKQTVVAINETQFFSTSNVHCIHNYYRCRAHLRTNIQPIKNKYTQDVWIQIGDLMLWCKPNDAKSLTAANWLEAILASIFAEYIDQ